MSVNGSDHNGGCPTDCVGVVSGIKRCDCADTRDVTETGFIVDGIVPPINAGQSGGDMGISTPHYQYSHDHL